MPLASSTPGQDRPRHVSAEPVTTGGLSSWQTDPVDRTIITNLDIDPALVFGVVSDLTTFPDWLDLVRRVEPTSPADNDPGPAYAVTLRANIGPFSRSKRLRMCRAGIDASTGHVEFVRHETDGRQHADWRMTADVTAGTNSDTASVVLIRLEYSGQMWSNLLDGALEHAVGRATSKLALRAGR